MFVFAYNADKRMFAFSNQLCANLNIFYTLMNTLRFNKLFTAILPLLIFLIASSSLKGQNKPLIGRVYRDLKEIKEFKNYYGHIGKMIPTKDYGVSDRFAVVQITDTIAKQHIIIFEELLKDPKIPGKPKYLILDVLYVDFKSQDSWMSLCECYQKSNYKPEIIALVDAQPNSDFTTKIRKAWCLEFKTKKIIPLSNKEVVKCSSQDEGCEEE
jgi:hypothetical protein